MDPVKLVDHVITLMERPMAKPKQVACGCEAVTHEAVGHGDIYVVEHCPLHAAAHDVLTALRYMLDRHDRATDHHRYEKGALYERSTARPKNDGRVYVFALLGPDGQGFYPCWCNPPRALLARLEGGRS